MDFGEVLTKAWKIIWKFKVLWIFGILSSCGQGSGNSGNPGGVQYSMDKGDLTPGMRHSSMPAERLNPTRSGSAAYTVRRQIHDSMLGARITR